MSWFEPISFKKEKRGPHLVSIIGMKNSDDDIFVDPMTSILTAEIRKGKIYMCHAFRSAKGMSTSYHEL